MTRKARRRRAPAKQLETAYQLRQDARALLDIVHPAIASLRRLEDFDPSSVDTRIAALERRIDALAAALEAVGAPYVHLRAFLKAVAGNNERKARR